MTSRTQTISVSVGGVALLLLFAFVGQAPAQTAPTVYTDPLEFNEATSSLGTPIVVNFDELNAGQMDNTYLGRTPFDGRFYAPIGFTFASPNGYPLFIAPGGLFWNESNSLSVGRFPYDTTIEEPTGTSLREHDDLSVTLATPCWAMGFTLVDNEQTDLAGESIQFMDADGGNIAQVSLPHNLDSFRAFVGIVSVDRPVASIKILEAANDGDDVNYDDFTCFPAALNVDIDIKPGRSPNFICSKSRYPIPVAILTTNAFDATTVDPSTVHFGPNGTEAAPVKSALEDVDRDGDTDMMLLFKVQNAHIECGDTSASLMGETFNGQVIRGSDSIQTPSCPCVQPPSGLVSWWPGDGNVDDIKDSNDGRLEGGATFSSGKVGQAFSLDAIDDFVDAGNAPNLHVSEGDFTVDAWVFFNALAHPPGANIGAPQGDMSILDKMSAGGINTDGWRLLKQDDNRFWFCLGGGTGNRCLEEEPEFTVISTTVATTGVWYHVAAVKSAGSFSIYVNGQLEDSRSPVPSFLDTNSANLRIGSYALEGSHLNGLIDEVEIFNRALSTAEIQAIYWAGSKGKCKGITVSIDIKPGRFPNYIYPRSRCPIPVAILTTDAFDATTVDPTTVHFGPNGTEAAPVKSALKDVDGDGDTDMILYFKAAHTGIKWGDTSATLKGETLGGQAIKGSDSVRIVWHKHHCGHHHYNNAK